MLIHKKRLLRTFKACCDSYFFWGESLETLRTAIRRCTAEEYEPLVRISDIRKEIGDAGLRKYQRIDSFLIDLTLLQLSGSFYQQPVLKQSLILCQWLGFKTYVQDSVPLLAKLILNDELDLDEFFCDMDQTHWPELCSIAGLAEPVPFLGITPDRMYEIGMVFCTDTNKNLILMAQDLNKFRPVLYPQVPFQKGLRITDIPDVSIPNGQNGQDGFCFLAEEADFDIAALRPKVFVFCYGSLGSRIKKSAEIGMRCTVTGLSGVFTTFRGSEPPKYHWAVVATDVYSIHKADKKKRRPATGNLDVIELGGHRALAVLRNTGSLKTGPAVSQAAPYPQF